MSNFENAERVLIPKGRDMGIVLDWIEQKGFARPQAPSDDVRCLHFGE